MTIEEWLAELSWQATYRRQVYHVGIRDGRWRVLACNDHLSGRLSDILSSADLIVYPNTDLIIPLRRVNWLWYVETSRYPLRLGNAEQAEKYVRGDVAAVIAVEYDDILGCSAFLDGDWSGVPTAARSFPVTSGV